MKKYYKVVRLNGNKTFISARASQWGGGVSQEFAVQYRIGEFAKPKVAGTKLFVFDDLDEAQSFADSSDVIFECEVKNPRKAKYGSFTYRDVALFWKVRQSRKSTKEIQMILPDHTIFCDAVMLTKEVD
jgi:hypothetical protein